MSQNQVDELVTDFVIGTVQSLRIVEETSFINLVQGLQPNRHVLNRKALSNIISERFSKMKTDLITLFSDIEFISTTADIWTSRHRAFLGMTAHWVNAAPLERNSAALCCIRLRGKHDFRLLANKINEVHSEYRIQNKEINNIFL